MLYTEINFDNLNKRLVEQAYASANFEMSEEQKRKLIQDKFDRARVLRDALEKNPIYED